MTLSKSSSSNLTPEQIAANKRKANLDTIEAMFDDSGWLSAWEVSFLGSIQTRLKNRIDLSEKQQKVLDDLAKKYMERLEP